MVTFTVTVKDEEADAIKKVLTETFMVENLKEEHTASVMQEPETPYERLKKIQLEIGDKRLFKDIKDPSEWQREIRKEWDRDF